MSTDTMGENDVLPMVSSVEVGGDLDAAVADDHEIARAEDEGMHDAKPLPVPGEAGDDEAAFTNAERMALGELYEIQDRLDRAKADHHQKAESAKDAKKRVESLVEDMDDAVRRLRNARDAATPDPEKFPLFDKAKAQVDAMFPKPEGIPPLPAETFEEEYRRRAEATAIDDIGLKPATSKILWSAGLRNVASVGRYTSDGMSLTAIDTDDGKITARRQEEIVEAIRARESQWAEEWDAAHPDQEGGE